MNISASPFHLLRDREREEMFQTRARDNSAYVAFCNTVGGQDELIFDGHSRVLDDEGNVLARAPGFEEALLVVDVDPSSVVARRLTDARRRALARDRGDSAESTTIHVGAPHRQSDHVTPVVTPFSDELEQMRIALELGLSDYVRKNGFREVVVGVSGGIDSALVAALAVEALGAERVHCVSMPSRFSSEGREPTRGGSPRASAATSASSRSSRWSRRSCDAQRTFAGREPDLTEENLQARIRGTLLMALSNKFGWLLVATGNKSELSVGYATLYGDMAGGFALLKDVFKTDVFRLARHLNERAGRELIPQSIVDRAPSASCAPTSSTRTPLPPYPALDRVLEAYVEDDRTLEELSSDGFDRDVVERAVALIDRAEYKRAPGPARRAPAAEGLRARPAHADHEPLDAAKCVAPLACGGSQLDRRAASVEQLADERVLLAPNKFGATTDQTSGLTPDLDAPPAAGRARRDERRSARGPWSRRPVSRPRDAAYSERVRRRAHPWRTLERRTRPRTRYHRSRWPRAPRIDRCSRATAAGRPRTRRGPLPPPARDAAPLVALARRRRRRRAAPTGTPRVETDEQHPVRRVENERAGCPGRHGLPATRSRSARNQRSRSATAPRRSPATSTAARRACVSERPLLRGRARPLAEDAAVRLLADERERRADAARGQEPRDAPPSRRSPSA